MNQAELFMTIAKAGIDPAKVFPRLNLTESPRLRAPTTLELSLIRSSLTHSPLIGAESAFATVFPGWNIWAVYQVRDLPFSLLMVGVSRNRQLQIWVEDHIRLEAPAAKVADPLDLKGGQIQILNGPPSLKEAQSKEQVPGPGMVLETQDLEPELRFVRFFNRGVEAVLPWPHDEAYLLDRVYLPDPGNEATKGPGPGTITERNVLDPTTRALLTGVLPVVAIGLLGYAAVVAYGKHGSKSRTL